MNQELNQLGQRITVSVVGDDKPHVEVLGELFNIKGYEPILSFKGEDAIAVAYDQSLDIKLALIPVAGMPDCELKDLMAAHAIGGIKVIIYGGWGRKEDLPEMFDMGASAFIQTPQPTDILFNTIESVLIGESGIAVEGPQGWRD